jgi:uncharacterized protein (TIRG00374 family)
MKKEYRTYLLGSLVFIALVTITFRLVFQGFRGAGTLAIPEILTLQNLLIIAGVLIAFYLLDGLRLYFVFRTLGQDVRFLLMLKLVFINIFASGVTPLATGGGFAQIYYLTKYKVPLGVATAATTIRTVIASVMIFASVPLILVHEKGIQQVVPVKHGFLLSLLLILFYISIILLLVRKKENLKKFISSCIRLLNKVHIISDKKTGKLINSAETELELFNTALKSFRKGPVLYKSLSLFCAVAYLVLLFIFPYILIKPLNEKVSLITVISIQILITFLIYFTPTPGGSGVAEGSFALIFSNFLDSSYIAPLTFYWRFLTTYLGMVIGLFIFYREILRRNNTGSTNGT